MQSQNDLLKNKLLKLDLKLDNSIDYKKSIELQLITPPTGKIFKLKTPDGNNYIEPFFDNEYIRLCNTVIEKGTWQKNARTGKNCLFHHGDMMKFDLSSGRFPILTTKKVYTKQLIAELIGFIRGYDNAKQFRDLGCTVWDANANVSKHWLENPNRKGEDDLGRIYGVQARQWSTYDESGNLTIVDQLKSVIDKLSNGIDDRRLIVSHWNPGELQKMSLPSCHLLYQFGIRDGHLDLCMYQRSADVPLGVPFNIASYALLLNLVAQITNLKPGVFTHFLWNVHIYEDQLDPLKEQLTRVPFISPKLNINKKINSLNDLETWVTTNDFTLSEYTHHPAIKFPFSE